MWLQYIDCNCNLPGACKVEGDILLRTQFTVSGHQVCKDFYRRATGFSKNHFNKIYKEVVTQTPQAVAWRHVNYKNYEHRVDDAISFLDNYFKAETPGL